MNTNTILANIVFTTHLLLVLFIILTPFCTNNLLFLLLHIVSILSLIVHWYMNDNICCLTYLEGCLRGIEYNKGFLHKFIGPVYDYRSNFSYEVCLVLILISIYKFSSDFKRRYNEVGHENMKQMYKEKEYQRIVLPFLV